MGLIETYEYYLYERADPRTLYWTFNSSPFSLIGICLAYLFIVRKLIPAYMEHRPAYSLQTYIRFYNAFQVVVNAIIIYRVCQLGWFEKAFMRCLPLTYAVNEEEMTAANITWWATALKVTDLSETMVFALRKKQNQISFLHLYHHISTIWICWFVMRYYCGIMPLFYLLVNCSVHVVMYSYYLLSTVNHSIIKSTINTIKPFITIMQMVQFVILLLFNTLVFDPGCHNTWPASLVSSANLGINFYLFYDFYKKAYEKPKKK